MGWREWGLSAIMGVMFMVAFVLMARALYGLAHKLCFGRRTLEVAA